MVDFSLGHRLIDLKNFSLLGCVEGITVSWLLVLYQDCSLLQGPHQVGKSGKSREFCDRSGSRENVGKNKTP